MEKVQKKYKDNVFRKLFNTKENALVLYNILHNTNYENYNDIELVTLEDILYNNRKNDLAFTFNNKFVILVEQQSTVNENMPLRMLIYIARLYEKLVKDENIYREKLIKINACEFYVLYNGTKDLLDKNKNKVTEKILRLSDAFKEINEIDIQLELIVKVIDIRYNTNTSINQNNNVLMNYNYFIYLIEKYKKNNQLEVAIKKSITQCIEENILKEFLIENSSEVINMLTIEYNADIEKKVIAQENFEQGLEQGLEQGVYENKIETIRRLLDMNCNIDFISKAVNLPIQEIQKLNLI